MRNRRWTLRNACLLIIVGYLLFSFCIWPLFHFTDLYTLLGFHSPLYAFFLILNGGTLESNFLILLGAIVFVFGIVMLLLGTLFGLWKRKYTLFICTLFIDAGATFSYGIFNIFHAGFMPLHILMLVGGLIDVVLAILMVSTAKRQGTVLCLNGKP